jgi:hypothetical protein
MRRATAGPPNEKRRPLPGAAHFLNDSNTNSQHIEAEGSAQRADFSAGFDPRACPILATHWPRLGDQTEAVAA